MKISAILILPIIAGNFISQKEANGFLSDAKVRVRRFFTIEWMHETVETSQEERQSEIVRRHEAARED